VAGLDGPAGVAGRGTAAGQVMRDTG
jgi:hypothetical protein